MAGSRDGIAADQEKDVFTTDWAMGLVSGRRRAMPRRAAIRAPDPGLPARMGRAPRVRASRRTILRGVFLALAALAWGIVASDGRALAGTVAPAQATKMEEVLSEPRVQDRYLVRQWTTQHGLPQNTVTCLEQTADGYLWIGTRYGLVRHDGLGMTVFLAELDDVATDAVDVRQLLADPDGTLWILTRRGLFAHREGRFVRVRPGLPGAGEASRVECLARAGAGGVWLGGSFGVVRWANGVAHPAVDRSRGFDGESVSELFEDRRGRLWLQVVRKLNRAWMRWDVATGNRESLRGVVGAGWPEPDPRHPYRWESVHEGRDGGLWVADARELVRLGEDGVASRVPAGAWEGRSVRRLLEDGDGGLWIITEGMASLHRFDGRAVVPLQEVGGMVLPSDLRAMLADREGNLWLGTGNAGVFRLQPRPLLARRPRDGWSREEAFSIVPRTGGGAWVGTLRGLIRAGADGTTVFDGRDGHRSVRCKPVLEDRQGRVWVGVFGNGLGRLDEGALRSLNVLSPGGSILWQVRCLFEDAGGGIWAGTDVGLLRWTSQGPQWLTRTNGLSSDVVLAMAQTPDGALWAGTDGGGLNRFGTERGGPSGSPMACSTIARGR